jgi:hypothetical protein
MFVDRKKIRFDQVGSGVTIDIPIRLDFTPTDNSELVQDKFVEDEKDKSINPIEDYKKVRFKPAKVDNDGQWTVVDEFQLGVNMFTKASIGAGSPVYSTTQYSSYGDILFTDEDMFCLTNRLTKSFLTLNFYNSPNVEDNIFLYFSRNYTQIGDDQRIDTGQVANADDAPISYTIGDPVLKPSLIHEGFHIYWYKDLVDNGDNQEYHMYMTAEYNNAANGETSLLYTLPTTDINNLEITDINGPNGGLFLKCILKNVNGEYLYAFDPKSIQTGVDWGTAINEPTITFYQVVPGSAE